MDIHDITNQKIIKHKIEKLINEMGIDSYLELNDFVIADLLFNKIIEIDIMKGAIDNA